MILNYYHAYFIITMPEICKIFGLMNILELCLFSQTKYLCDTGPNDIIETKRGKNLALYRSVCSSLLIFVARL